MPTLLATDGAPAASDDLGDTSAPPEPPNPVKLDSARLHGLFRGETEFYTALGDAGDVVRTRIGEQANPLRERQRIANTAFLADRFRLSAREVADRYDTLRQSYAQQMFPDVPAVADEGVFFTEVSHQLQRERQEAELMGNLNRQLFKAAIEGKDFKSAWVGATVGANATPEARKRADVYNAWALQRWEANASGAAKLAPVIRTTAEFLADVRRGKNWGSSDALIAARRGVTEALATLDPQERSTVMALAAERAQDTQQRERGAVGATVETLAEGAVDLVDDALVGLYNTTEALIGHTREEQARQDRYQIERTLDQVIQGEIDPIKGDSFAGQIALDFTRSVPTMLAALTPAGLTVDYFALKQNAREKLESEGIRGPQAEALATIQAIPQTALFFASSKMVFLGKTPAAFGTSIPATLATEYVGNFALNEAGFLTDAGIQALAATFTEAVPEVDWQEFGRSFIERLPQQLAFAIPGALIGTGVARFQNKAAGKAYLQQPALLDDLGFTPEAKAAVVEAPTYEAAEVAFKEGYEERSEPAPAPTTAGLTFRTEMTGNEVTYYALREGKRVGQATFAVEGKSATPVLVTVPEAFRRQGIATSIYDYFASQHPGVTIAQAVEQTPEGKAFRAKYRQPAQPSALPEVETVRALDGAGFQQWAKQQKGGFTTTAHRIGQAVRSRAEVNALLRGQTEAQVELETAAAKAKGGDFEAMNEAMLLSTKAQFFREAYEAALGELSAGQRLRELDPNFVPPITRNADGTYRVQAVEGAPPVIAASPEGAAMVEQAQRTEAAQVAATAPPEPRPEADGRALPPRVTALNKEAITALRSLFNMDELDAPTRERFVQVLDEAKRTEAHKSADVIAADILATGRVASAAEHAALVLRSAELQNHYEGNAGLLSDALARGDTAAAEQLQTVGNTLQAQLDTLTAASDAAGTQIARALSIRRMRLNRDDYTLARVVQRARSAKQGELTPEKLAEFQALTEQLAEQRRIVEEQRTALLQSDMALARASAETFVAEGRARRRAARVGEAAMRRRDLKRELLGLGMRVNDITSVIGLSFEQARLVAKIADTYIEEGVASLAELTNKLKADIPDLSDQDIYTAVGRQTKKEAAKIENEAKRRVKELRAQAALWAKINAALEDRRPDGSPINRKQKNKLLRETLIELRRQANRTTFDDVALKRVDTKIAEIQNHLREGTRNLRQPEIAVKPSEKLSAARETLRLLREEMGALDTIEDLEASLTEATPKPATAGQPPPPPPSQAEQRARLNTLRERIAELRDQIDAAQVDPAAVNAERLAKLQRLSAELETQLEEGFRVIPEGRRGVPETDQVAAARKQLHELQRLMRTEDSIADLTEQIRTREYKVSAPEQRIITNAKLEAALIRQRQLKRKVDQLIDEARPKGITDRINEAFQLVRALKTTADMGAILRQGLLLSASRPVTAARTFLASVRALLSENTSDAIALALENRPLALEGQKAGLYLSDIGAAATAREEHFQSNLAERIPGWGRIVRASNRSMVTTLNLLRVAAFDSFVQAHPEATPAQKKAYAEYVNAASGRGNVKWSPSTTKTLNAVFFAPRYAVSRFQALYSPFKNFRDPIVRNAILKDFGALMGTGMSVLVLASLAGADVSLDPSESDFGKIVIDDTRIDIWGGLQQPARLILQGLLAGPQRAEVVELEKDIDPLEASLRFLSYKLSPAATVPLELVTGKDIIGEEAQWWETVGLSVVPLSVQEAVTVGQETESVGAAAAAGLAAFLGVGVQQHK